MNVDRLATVLAEAEFQEAKTMPGIPHSYTLKKKWGSPVLFEEVVQAIRNQGTPERFFRKAYVYFYANGFKYWTMGSPISDTTLINRTKQ